MKNLSRRTFIRSSVVASVAGSSGLIARVSHAQDVVNEDDPTAVSLGYKADHSTVDTSVWTRKAGADGAGQQCTSCALYQKIDEEYGQCPIFAGKRVHASGWCSGWVGK